MRKRKSLRKTKSLRKKKSQRMRKRISQRMQMRSHMKRKWKKIGEDADCITDYDSEDMSDREW